MFEVKVVNRKYAQAVLTTLRDKNTSQIEFRKGLVRLGRILGLELIEDFECEKTVVETPLGARVDGCRIKDLDNIVVITVLRAAWPLTEGLIKVLFTAKQGVVAARRVEEKGMKAGSFEIEISYVKTPRITSRDVVVISDVMVATGSTLVSVLEKLREKGVAKRYYVASVITTPHAIGRLKKYAEEAGIDLKLYTIAIDPEIDEKGYIVPGLGDAGDRAFGS
ncbi:uracil phosphoribosyltransferase [Desulfurococcus mucosus]|uniref:uracil phosphoribosyltransferase n=1 Tax=Desulfurococcus mucosus TaxID=2275 RepID=UPI00064F7E4E|nr:uracil phosphoribosyltransferase [Desulfurococcus mucosus]